MSRLLSELHVPGAFWVALIAFTIQWLPRLFPEASWVPTALVILIALLKAIEVLTSHEQQTVRGLAAERSRWWRFWFG